MEQTFVALSLFVGLILSWLLLPADVVSVTERSLDPAAGGD